MTVLPTIDVSSLTEEGGQRREPVADRICMACRDGGFLILTGHGIEQQLIDEVRRLAGEFFRLSLNEKMALRVTPDNYRGYIPLNFFTPNVSGTRPDAYEGYKLHAHIDADDPVRAECSLYGPNCWPQCPSGLARAVQRYWQRCDTLAERLVRVLLDALAIDDTFLHDALREPLTNMTLLHYPPPLPGHEPNGIHAHKDTDLLTILAADATGSLEIRPRGSERWHVVEIPDDGLVVNIGDMLETWSGGHYVSTPHRVVHTGAGSRISFPYFMVPRHDVPIAPLCEPQPGFQWTPITAGELSRKIWHSNWPDSSLLETCYDPAITEHHRPEH